MSSCPWLTLRYALGSNVGLRRSINEDSAYASPRMLALADGMGGHVHGEVASAVAISAIADLDDRLPADLRGVDLLGALGSAVADASRRLIELAGQNPTLQGMGTTLTAMLWNGSVLGVAHVGDSRGYLLRGGELHPITSDHTFVQALVDDGHLPPEEAAGHPRRSLLMRALQSTGPSEPDLFVREVLPGDRYLICSDGLSDVTQPDELHVVLATNPDPVVAVHYLIDLANSHGGPDNITCVIGDVVGTADPVAPSNGYGGLGQGRFVVGAVAESRQDVEPAGSYRQVR